MDLGWVFGRVWEALTAQRLDLWGHFWGTFAISIKIRILCHLGGGWGGFGDAFGRILGGFWEGLGVFLVFSPSQNVAMIIAKMPHRFFAVFVLFFAVF